MLDIAQQTIDYYTKYKKVPQISDLKISDESLLERQAQIFVTIYHKWEIAGSSWNMKEIESTAAQEIISNTIWAISKDPRFSPITIDQVADLKIRIDEITSREILSKTKDLAKIDPVKHGVIAIKQDYSDMCVILPNISPLLLMGSDITWAIAQKLWEDFNEKKLHIYKIETNSINNI